jgi:hypothetical protein
MAVIFGDATDLSKPTEADIAGKLHPLIDDTTD